MFSEDELVESPNDILLILFVLIVQMLYQPSFDQALLIKSLFVFQNF